MMSVCGKQWGMCGKCGGGCGKKPHTPPHPVQSRPTPPISRQKMNKIFNILYFVCFCNALGIVCNGGGGVCNKTTPPATPVRFRSKSTVIAHKDDNSVVGFFIFLEYMIAFIQ